MKGSAKIELRDAKSGRLVKQVEKHNIVTNGAMNVMKIKQAYNSYNLGDDNYSLIEKYFGGILLFGASLDETENNAIPSAEVRASYIGHASCIYTITGDSYMGTYVAGESSIGAHNAKLVFSFDATQANGDINCICLTSGEGGIFGYGVDALPISDARHTPYSLYKFYADDRFRYENYSYPVKFKDNKSYNYYPGKTYVSDFSVAKNLGLNLSIKDSGAYYKFSRGEKTTITPVGYSRMSDYSRYWSLDTDRVVCQSIDKSTPEGNKNIVEFEVIDVGEDNKSYKIPLDYTNMVAALNQKAGLNYDHNNNLFSSGSANWALFKDYVLSIQRNTKDERYLCIANILTGDYVIKELWVKALADFGYEQEFVNILGTIYLRGNYKESSGMYLYYRVNLDTAEVAHTPEFFSDEKFQQIHTTLDPDMPPIINVDTSSGYLAPYLATINNVDTLEKNVTRTLKITYNLEYGYDVI